MIQNKYISDMDSTEFDLFLFMAIAEIDELTVDRKFLFIHKYALPLLIFCSSYIILYIEAYAK